MKLKSFGVLFSMVVFIAAHAEATTYYLNTSEAGKTANAWTTPSLWLDENGNAASSLFDPECDYVIGTQPTAQKASYLRWPNNNAYINFGGRSMTICNSSSVRLSNTAAKQDNPVTFGTEGLLIDKGMLYPYSNGGTLHIGGIIRIGNGGATIQGGSDTAKPTPTACFYSTFYGDDNAVITITTARTNFVVIANADFSNFSGTLRVTSNTDSDKVRYGTRFTLNSNLQNAALEALVGSTVIVTQRLNAVQVKRLSFAEGSNLEIGVAADGTSSASLKALDSFELAVNLLKIKLTGIDPNQLVSTPINLTLFTVPLASNLAMKDVEISGIPADCAEVPRVELIRDETAQTISLVMKTDGLITQTVADTYNNYRPVTSAFSTESSWDAPFLNTARYYAGKLICTSYDANGTETFFGRSLTLASTMIIGLRDFHVDDLIINGGALAAANRPLDVANSAVVRYGVSGKITVLKDTVFRIQPWCGAKTELWVDSEICGEGDIWFQGRTGTSSVNGTGVLSAENDKFLGSIKVRQQTFTNSGNTYPDATHRQIFRFFKQSNLGGNLTEFNPKAFEIGGFTEVSLTNSIALLNSANRGIFVNDGEASINCAEDVVLTSAWPLAMNGTLIKSGAGRLVLANETVAFGVDAEDAEPSEVVAEHTLRINEGEVEIAALDAINGLNVVFAGENVRLVLDPLAQTGDFARYGIRNVKTDTPFALADGVSAARLVLEPSTAPTESFTSALFTVKSEIFEQTAAMFMPIVRPEQFRGWKLTCIPRDNNDGTMTMVMTVEPTGFVLEIR